MRQGELLALQWDAVDMTSGMVQVKQTIARIGHQGFVVSEPKTAKSRRSIHLTRLALEALRKHRIHQRELRLAAGSAWSEQGWIFCNAVGKPIEADNLLRRSFWPLLHKAGLAQMPFHSLRHRAASILLALGVNPKVIQEMLGHSTISMTLDTYSHVIPAMHANSVKQLDILFTWQENPVAVTVAVNAEPDALAQ
jgi:integrase